MNIYQKSLLLFTLYLTGLTTMQAQDQKVIKSSLKEVTVFFTGAELIHTANVNLAAGENEFMVEGLSPQVDVNSIKIKTTHGVIISSFEFTVDHLSNLRTESPQTKQLKELLEKQKSALEQVGINIRINEKLRKQLEEGISKNVSGSENGLGIDDLIKTIDYLKSKSYELEQESVKLAAERKELQETIRRIENQLREINADDNKTSGLLSLNLLAPANGTQDLEISYFTPTAGWIPSYDVQVKDTDVPVLFRLRANVWQNTGLDWIQVKPTLSSGRPGNGKVAPLFNTWFLRPQVAPQPRMNAAMAQNSFSYKQAEMTASPVMDEEYEEDISEIVIPAYGMERKSTSIQEYVVASDAAIDLHFAISLPYTIPDNGKPRYIDLQTYEAQAEYKYYVTPKLDKQTYVLAEIAEWEKLGLLSGTANVTYNGTYLGETYLNASSTSEKQTLTLGTDPRVVVKREKVQDFSSRKAIGGDVVHQFTYQITVKNNRNQPVKMVTKDQYPVSTQKNIEVNLLQKESTPWTANNEQVGVISWEEEFQPGETKVYKLTYTVKYPRDMKLNL